jgi:pyruvate kinase
VAKIEKPSAIEHIDDIVRLSDAVMVARGDLGVEIPPEDVPGRQKEIIRMCRLSVKPVIVATQMLDSMIGAPTPTRAEASDVATAVYDGADAVMLSAESASGSYPCEAVEMMDRIVRSSPLHSRKSNTRLRMPSRLPLLISPRLSRRLRSSRLLRVERQRPGLRASVRRCLSWQ